MSFADVLNRLHGIATNRQRGVPHEQCVVNRRDLQELLHRFNDYDAVRIVFGFDS